MFNALPAAGVGMVDTAFCTAVAEAAALVAEVAAAV
jgi:hypothetical protein